MACSWLASHALLGLTNLEAVRSHPIAGQSWEGHVIEQLISAAPQALASYYRTSQGAECDLVLTFPGGKTYVCEIKRSTAPVVSRGFYEAVKDLHATQKWVIALVPNPYPGKEGVEVMRVSDAVKLLSLGCSNPESS